jgi:hypothetical protein
VTEREPLRLSIELPAARRAALQRLAAAYTQGEVAQLVNWSIQLVITSIGVMQPI